MLLRTQHVRGLRILVVAMAIAAVAVGYANAIFIGRSIIGFERWGTSTWRFTCGWPLIHRRYETLSDVSQGVATNVSIRDDQINGKYLGVNLLTLVAALVSFSIVAWRATRKLPRLQISLRSLLISVGLLACLLGILRFEWSDSRWLYAFLDIEGVSYYPASNFSLWISIPLFVGVLSIVYVLSDLLLSAIDVIARKFRSS